jgi:hypothetical protein
MYWIIQDNIFKEKCFDEFIKTFERFDIQYQIVKCVPFSHEIIPPINKNLTDIIAIGSYGMTNKILNDFGEGSWTNSNYNYNVWSKKWAGYCFNEGEVYNFNSVAKPSNDLFFIRPVGDDKDFNGKIISWDDFCIWQNNILNLKKGNYTNLSAETEVLVSEVKPIEEEYRFVVVDKEPITASTYGSGKIQRYVGKDNELLYNFVKEVIDIWVPSEVFCLDIVLSCGEYKVMEMGNFNSCGLYDNDIQKIVFTLENR